MSMMVSFVLSFFPRDVLDEILKLIESVSEDFPSCSWKEARNRGQSRRKPNTTDSLDWKLKTGDYFIPVHVHLREIETLHFLNGKYTGYF